MKKWWHGGGGVENSKTMLIYLMDGPKGPAKPAILRFSSFLFFPILAQVLIFPILVLCALHIAALWLDLFRQKIVSVFHIPIVWTSLNNTDFVCSRVGSLLSWWIESVFAENNTDIPATYYIKNISRWCLLIHCIVKFIYFFFKKSPT